MLKPFFASLLCLAVAGGVFAQEKDEAKKADDDKPAAKTDSVIRPPAEINVDPDNPKPAEGGEKQESGDGLNLTPEGQRLLEQSSERTRDFGLDMAERGIDFGLRFVDGQTYPGEAEAFGFDMLRRGEAFAREMRPQVDRIVEESDLPEGEALPQVLPRLLGNGQNIELPPDVQSRLQQLRQRIQQRRAERGFAPQRQRQFRFRREF